MGVGCDLRRGGAAGADGPDGLVGEDDFAGLRVFDAFKRDRGLQLQDLRGKVGLALFQMLADADDGDEAVGEGGLELEVDGGVGLGEVLAALGANSGISSTTWPVTASPCVTT